MDILTWVQQWYSSQCDGEWEQEYGMGISTIGNPGWMVDINLADTEMEEIPFEKLDIERTENDWYQCWIEDEVFHGAGGVSNLSEVLEIFRDWVTKNTTE